MKRFIGAIVLSMGLIFTSTVIAKNDKVTICHAAGRAGTTHYVTITISENAVYGPGGHFNENGTTQAGHEQDYFGPCNVEPTPTPVSTPEPTPTPTSEPTPEPTPQITPTPEVTPEPTPETPDVPSGGGPDVTPRITLPPTDTE